MDSMKKKNKILMILGVMAFLANGDNYAAAPLLGNIAVDFGIPVSTAALSVMSYMLSFGLFTLILGPLSDKYGKTKIINISAIGTAIFSILGGFAFNLPSLIFLRVMNGAFGAGIFPITMALVGEMFGKDRREALAKVMGLMFLGGATATAIGGTLAYIGSWRLVYVFYGVAELIMGIVMLKVLEKDKVSDTRLSILASYKAPLTNYRFMRLVTVIFFVGFSVFGTFTYSGRLLESTTTLNVLQIGLILSLFGLGTVFGGKIAPKVNEKLGHSYLVVAGILGLTSLYLLSATANLYIIGISLVGFGLAFIFMQSSLIGTAQEKLPQARGTAMSLASFCMFVGGATGTALNGKIMDVSGPSKIFLNASFLMLVVGLLAAIFIGRFEMRRRQGYYATN